MLPIISLLHLSRDVVGVTSIVPLILAIQPLHSHIVGLLWIRATLTHADNLNLQGFIPGQMQKGWWVQDALRDVQVTLETAKSREASIPPRKPAAAATLPPDIDLEAGPDSTEQQALLQQQQQQETAVLNNELDYQEALIEERDQGISEIQRSIADVHEIFQVRGLDIPNACLEDILLVCLNRVAWCARCFDLHLAVAE